MKDLNSWDFGKEKVSVYICPVKYRVPVTGSLKTCDWMRVLHNFMSGLFSMNGRT